MRHLLLSSLLLLSGCSLIRVQGLPFGSTTNDNRTSEPAKPLSSARPFAAPLTVQVPAQGVVLRVTSTAVEPCNRAELGAPVAIVDVPPGEWTIESPNEKSVWFLTEKQRAAGDCGGGSSRTSLAPGRYIIGFNTAPKAGQALLLAIRPDGKFDPLLHAEVPAEVPLEDRVVSAWFPYFDRTTPAALLAVVPRQLFVYAPAGSKAQLAPASNEQFSFRNGSSSSSERPTMVPVQENEPLLLLRPRGQYLSSDLSLVNASRESDEPAMLAAPTGPVPLPKVRNAWAPASVLLPGPSTVVSGTPLSDQKIAALPAALQPQVRAYYQDLNRSNGCQIGARDAYYAATTGVVITESVRRAAQARRERDEALCKPMLESLKRNRERVLPPLAAQRTADVQAEADVARPHLVELFGTP
ncbi:MAG: hypothetical protein JNM17_23270 [Archangium sp.]|nr:hypothetical protein [Archangium sp.]